MKLQGRVAAITGGTRGIGRGIAAAFLAEGARVVINGRSDAKGARTLAELDAGERAAFVAGDVQSAAGAERVVAAAIERYGRIVNISSVESRTVNKPNVGHYVANKHAINGLTKAVAFENGQYGITCNAILPGAIETDIMREGGAAAAQSMGLSYEEFLGGYAQEAAIRRINTVEEVAAVAVLLASDVGGGITGALLDVSGGTGL